MHALISQDYKNRIRKSLVFISYERSNKISEYSFIAQSIALTIRPLCLSLLIKKVNQRLPLVKLFDTQGEEELWEFVNNLGWHPKPEISWCSRKSQDIKSQGDDGIRMHSPIVKCNYKSQ